MIISIFPSDKKGSKWMAQVDETDQKNLLWKPKVGRLHDAQGRKEAQAMASA
jgi:hypothetical protein